MRIGDLDALEEFLADEYGYPVIDILGDIAKFPTIDAVPVARCKDCKWYNPDTDYGFDEVTGRRDRSKIVKKQYGECQGQNFHFTEDGFLRVGDDDFCSYGERKDGDG